MARDRDACLIVEAFTSGALQPPYLDPANPRWWKKLRWTLDTLHREKLRHTQELRHAHWTSLATNAKLLPQAFTDARTAAKSALASVLAYTFPWLADSILATEATDERDLAVKQYHDTFGKPGEPRYEMMMSEYRKTFRGKLTQFDKERRRAEIRAKWAVRRQDVSHNDNMAGPGTARGTD